MSFSLEGKVALITGASRGIGQATAMGFARAGADVVLASRKLPELEIISENIKGLGRRSLAVATHMGKMEDIGNLVTRVKEKFGRLDILVNNAGTNPTIESALEISERAWDSVMNVNLKGVFFLSQQVARLMKEKGGGCIINVSSWAGIKAQPLVPAYSVSKAGVIMATKIMACEWAKYNIRVNVIVPGQVKTHMNAVTWENPEIRERFLKTIPLGRFAEPEEIVGTMIYLASDAANYVTGAVVSVDGGYAL